MESVKVDKDNLDYELVRQPSLVFNACKRLAEKTMDLEILKSDADLRRKVVATDVRSYPENYDLSKVTEAAISEVVEQDVEVLEAEVKMRELRKEVAILKGEVKALDHKRSALEHLAKLFLANYYADLPFTTEEKQQLMERALYQTAHEKLEQAVGGRNEDFEE
jgi:hypothetical protein